ncbi:MAG: hypothetical protein F4Y39_11165 [Gemmatimonadetes bacterium]|nr:hypothetical protein [Gemmatimonadota bacterium]
MKPHKEPSPPLLTLGLVSLLSFLILLFPQPLSSQMSSFSLSMDLNESEGNQAIHARAVPSNQVVFIQIFGTDIQNAIGVFARFEYNTTQIIYEGFDAGDVLPNAQALIQQGSGSVEINIASLGGTATSNSGLIGTMRFRTTDMFSSTRIRLVRAELSRGGQFETVTLSLSVALQIFMPPSPDFDESGVVDFRDFVLLAGAFGSNQNEDKYENRLDLDSDGSIGFSDFLEFASHFGQAVLPPPQLILPVCDRTAQMRDAIVAATPVSTCGNVTDAHLVAIDSLGVVGTSLSELQADDFSGLTALTKLNLQENELTSLPDGISEDLPALTWLNLSNNHFTTIPPQLFTLSNLTYLNLENNELSGKIPEGLSNLTNLAELYLNDNASLTGTLPQNLTELTMLEKLLFQDTELCAPLNAVFQTWLQGITETNGSNCGNPGTYERSLLVALYNATDGDNWTNKTNWLSDRDLSTWHGVSVSNGWVTSLDLRDNNLMGTIPKELGNLTNLRYLNFYANQLSGEIPVELGNLSKLKSLDFWGNELSGEIPVELGNLSNLEYLRLSENKLSGKIPVELGNSSNLEYLSLGYNELSGEIPVELGNLTNLEHLELGANPLGGEIPKELANLTNLTYLRLSSNELSGSIPVELGNLSNLEHLDFRYNELSGEIPKELGNLSNLIHLDFRGNALSGSIPVALGNPSNLTYLRLEDNQLSGSVPVALGNLSNLEYLYLGDNTLSGSIPVALGNLINLTKLRFEDNKLSGAIPVELGNLINLTILRFEGNALSGEIPEELGDLSNLTKLRLDNNAFLAGALPQSLTGLTKLEQLFFENTGLCAPLDAAFQAWLQSIAETNGSNCASSSILGQIINR